jgi:hypothetical protein
LIPLLSSAGWDEVRAGSEETCHWCSSDTVHVFTPKGPLSRWACGYSTLKVVLSAILCERAFGDVAARIDGSNEIPSVPRIQRMLEAAWAAGYDLMGAQQIGPSVFGRRVKIGASDALAVLTHLRVPARLVDVEIRRSRDADDFFQRVECMRKALTQILRTHFRAFEAAGRDAPPVFCGVAEHNVAIVGLVGERWVVFDPTV